MVACSYVACGPAERLAKKVLRSQAGWPGNKHDALDRSNLSNQPKFAGDKITCKTELQFHPIPPSIMTWTG
jgi:hypothetical protein